MQLSLKVVILILNSLITFNLKIQQKPQFSLLNNEENKKMIADIQQRKLNLKSDTLNLNQTKYFVQKNDRIQEIDRNQQSSNKENINNQNINNQTIIQSRNQSENKSRNIMKIQNNKTININQNIGLIKKDINSTSKTVNIDLNNNETIGIDSNETMLNILKQSVIDKIEIPNKVFLKARKKFNEYQNIQKTMIILLLLVFIIQLLMLYRTIQTKLKNYIFEKEKQNLKDKEQSKMQNINKKIDNLNRSRMTINSINNSSFRTQYILNSESSQSEDILDYIKDTTKKKNQQVHETSQIYEEEEETIQVKFK